MLSVLPVCAVWRGNAEALKVSIQLRGNFDPPPVLPAVFLFGGDAEVVEALVCKTGLSGFESRRYLHS